MRIEKISIDNIKKYRTAYLNTLPEFQELFLELMIADAACYLLWLNNHKVGYAITNKDGVLIEFYLMDPFIAKSKEIFGQLINELAITAIYCKSFDALLLSSCVLFSFPYSVIGVLYRHYVEPTLATNLDLRMEQAGLSTVPLLLSQDDSIKELFETEEQLSHFIQNGHVFTFHKNDVFIGCGMVLRTNPDWDYCDLGVWVSPSQRGNAMGAQILMNLRAFAIKNHMKPGCGCAIDNLASQKTIEKSGFVSKYKLLHFKTK